MEAATGTREANRSSASDDRDLALRFGALMMCTLSSDGGGVMKAIDESGLNFSQMKALVALAGGVEAEPATVKDVAERLGISLASASRAVDDLVRRALATRVEDPDDRRVRRVSLTAEGQEVADELIASSSPSPRSSAAASQPPPTPTTSARRSPRHTARTAPRPADDETPPPDHRGKRQVVDARSDVLRAVHHHARQHRRERRAAFDPA